MAPAKKTQASVESAKNGKVPPVFEPISLFFEKKVRNLEKRKTKLDAYRALQKDGKLTDLGQQQAVEKYEEVISNLAFSSTIMQELLPVLLEISTKIEKTSVDKEKEKDKQCKSTIRTVLDTLDIYEQLGDSTSRDAFVSGTQNATLLTEEQLATIDKLYLSSKPSRTNEDGSLKTKAEYKKVLDESVLSWHRLLKTTGGENKTGGEDMRALFESIGSCDYLDGSKRVVEVIAVDTEPEQPVEEIQPTPEPVEEDPPEALQIVAPPQQPPAEEYEVKPTQMASCSQHLLNSLQERAVNFVQVDYEHMTNTTPPVTASIIAGSNDANVATTYNGSFQDNYNALPNNISTMNLDNRQHFGHFNGNAFNQEPAAPPAVADAVPANMGFSNTTPQGTFPAAESWADETPEPVYDGNLNSGGDTFVEVKRGGMNQRYGARPNDYGRGAGGYRNDRRGMNMGGNRGGGGFESSRGGGGFNRPYRNDYRDESNQQGGMRQQDNFFPRGGGGGGRGYGGGGGKDFSSRGGGGGQGNRGGNRPMRGTNFDRSNGNMPTNFTSSNTG